MRFNVWRDIDSYPEIHRQTAELMRFLGLEGIEADRRRRSLLRRAAPGRPRHRARLQAAGTAARRAACRPRRRRARTRLEPGQDVAANIPVLIVEHDIDRVLGFSHRVTVMNQGEVLMTGTPEEVRADRRVQEIYTGTGTPEVGHSRGDDGAGRRANSALRRRQRLLRQEPHSQRRDARRARGRDRRVARAATAPANPRC